MTSFFPLSPHQANRLVLAALLCSLSGDFHSRLLTCLPFSPLPSPHFFPLSPHQANRLVLAALLCSLSRDFHSQQSAHPPVTSQHLASAPVAANATAAATSEATAAAVAAAATDATAAAGAAGAPGATAGRMRPSLLVVPGSAVAAWEGLLEQRAPELSVTVLRGSAGTREERSYLEEVAWGAIAADGSMQMWTAHEPSAAHSMGWPRSVFSLHACLRVLVASHEPQAHHWDAGDVTIMIVVPAH
ncbi:unnamed protein product [Closterium sp. NIES-65]|nr:unnamed protein product [Closterium sp. NIES-65]